MKNEREIVSKERDQSNSRQVRKSESQELGEWDNRIISAKKYITTLVRINQWVR